MNGIVRFTLTVAFISIRELYCNTVLYKTIAHLCVKIYIDRETLKFIYSDIEILESMEREGEKALFMCCTEDDYGRINGNVLPKQIYFIHKI